MSEESQTITDGLLEVTNLELVISASGKLSVNVLTCLLFEDRVSFSTWQSFSLLVFCI